jgi:integrase
MTMLLASKPTAAFMQQAIIKDWLNSAVQSPMTREGYAYHLMRFLEGIDQTPRSFLEAIEKDRKQTSIAVKSYIGSIQSKTVARLELCSIRSFVRFYEADLPLNGLKVRVARVRKKSYLSWADSEKIINECKEPYRSAFRFMRWAGIGLDEFMEIQRNPEIQTSIESQRSNSKPYIRIDLRPRKNNTDEYFVLIPKEYVPRFPLLTADYGNRGGQLIDRLDADLVWKRATKRAGLAQLGLGPHTLRSAFRSQCAKAGVSDAVAEFQMGHGSRDKYGYSREMSDESYVATEISKLWTQSVPVTGEELSRAEERIKQQEERIRQLEERLQAPPRVISLERAVEEGRIPGVRMTTDGPRFEKFSDKEQR